MPRPRSGRAVLVGLLSSLALTVGTLGCTAPLFRSQENDELEAAVDWSDDDRQLRLVGDVAAPWGINWLKVEGVALVTHLEGTGSDPPPSPLRDKLIKEMQTHDVKHYSRALASDDTAMVIVRGFIPPGARKHDVFDVEVQIPGRSKTSSLASGWLMQCRLREFQVLDTMREGHVGALASGHILVDSVFQAGGETVAATRGRIPGGGVVQKPRLLGLAIRDEHSSVRTSALIGAAINERFHHFDRGSKKGVANPQRDNLIELAVHPRYRNNLGRYIRVIQSLAVGESPAQRTLRLSTLQRMLLEPTSAQTAALQLEAIGPEGRPILLQGLQARDHEVVFYAAEALAYLDEPAAAEPLRRAAERERAFRWRALTALAAMDNYQAQESLAELLHVPSAETRYGAFRALRLRNHRDPLVGGEVLNREFAYHRLASTAEPLIHFSRTRRPELVVFGNNLRLQPLNFFYAGNSILIKALDESTLQLSSFRPGKEDRFEQCSPQLDDVIRAISAVGGTYADVFDGLREAKSRGFLEARIEVDAIPRSNRRYDRAAAAGESPEVEIHVDDPIPEAFQDHLESTSEPSDDDPLRAQDETTKETKSSFFDKMTDWMVVE